MIIGHHSFGTQSVQQRDSTTPIFQVRLIYFVHVRQISQRKITATAYCQQETTFR
jgi:hypothetical protein